MIRLCSCWLLACAPIPPLPAVGATDSSSAAALRGSRRQLQSVPEDYAVRINVGGGEFTDIQGRSWQADESAIGGTYGIDCSNTNIRQTQNDEMYCSFKWFDPENSNNEPFIYKVSVAHDGEYKLRFHFAEIVRYCAFSTSRNACVCFTLLCISQVYSPFNHAYHLLCSFLIPLENASLISFWTTS